MRILRYSTAIPFMRNCLAHIVAKTTIDNKGDGYMLNALADTVLRNAAILCQKDRINVANGNTYRLLPFAALFWN